MIDFKTESDKKPTMKVNHMINNGIDNKNLAINTNSFPLQKPIITKNSQTTQAKP